MHRSDPSRQQYGFEHGPRVSAIDADGARLVHPKDWAEYQAWKRERDAGIVNRSDRRDQRRRARRRGKGITR